ncbi:alpha/beta hydrolase [Streptomyces sp. NPDC090306]|uniref:alpha/beta hydrolase n=1 Tax=Streptomyces sp. NPDC090306 TaxID=3365961 RepID=UPI003810BC2A
MARRVTQGVLQRSGRQCPRRGAACPRLKLLHLTRGPSIRATAPGRRAGAHPRRSLGLRRPPPRDRRAGSDRPGSGGPLPVRLYSLPGLDGPSALLVCFHGGGWVLGDLEAADPACMFLAVHAGLSVLSVDYRLTPDAAAAQVPGSSSAPGRTIDSAASTSSGSVSLAGHEGVQEPFPRTELGAPTVPISSPGRRR